VRSAPTPVTSTLTTSPGFRYSGGFLLCPTPEGVPVLEDTVVQLSCSVVTAHLAGDHTIVIGKVEDAEIQGGEPLLFFRGEYRHIGRQ